MMTMTMTMSVSVMMMMVAMVMIFLFLAASVTFVTFATLLQCMLVQFEQFLRVDFGELRHKVPQIASPFFDFLRVFVDQETLVYLFANAQQTSPRLADLFFRWQCLVRVIKRLECFLHRPHLLLAFVEHARVQIPDDVQCTRFVVGREMHWSRVLFLVFLGLFRLRFLLLALLLLLVRFLMIFLGTI